MKSVPSEAYMVNLRVKAKRRINLKRNISFNVPDFTTLGMEHCVIAVEQPLHG
jgi:hypothetical protein